MTVADSDPARKNWKPFIAHDRDVLVQGIDLFKTFGVVVETTQALNRLRIHDFASGKWSNMSFSEPVYSVFPGGTPEYDTKTFRYNYQSFVTPSSVYDYSVETGQSTLLKRQEVLGGFDPTQYASERLWVTARDGEKVPVSIVYKKGRAKDGKSPLLLYGYGSYGISMSAGFSSSNFSLIDRGVAYAVAHIRGGKEMGERWHEDGMLMKKKNTFNDFIDCADFLVKNKWTSKDGLMIEGGSAGGLLMGAVVNMRPDLFRAVHSAVPFVDVMNTMMDATLPLTVGEYLEWGNPNEKKAYDYMKSYSPYDNLEKHAYPAILVTSSLNDSQVMYWEPAKYVARLRTLKTNQADRPLLLKMRMETAGHGGASGRYDRLKDQAFEFAWFLSQVGINQ
jgi:oligopeptidase B